MALPVSHFSGTSPTPLGYNKADESSPLSTMPTPMQNNTPPTDAALMARIGTGDRAAYTQLVDRHMSRGLNFVFRHMRNTATAEDILQEGFLKVWQHAATWEPQAQFTTWFYKLLYHMCVDYWRKHRRPMEDMADFHEILADKAPSAEEKIITHQQDTLVRNALNQLPENQRTALMLFHYQELSQYEIASVMQLSVGAIESLLFRGRKKMKELLTTDKILLRVGEKI